MKNNEKALAVRTGHLALDPKEIKAFCKADKLSWDTFFKAVHAYLLTRFSGEEEVPFHTKEELFRHFGDSTPEAGFSVKAVPEAHSVLLEVSYDPDQDSEEMADQYLESLGELVRELISGKELSEAGFTSEAQLQLLDSFNRTDVPYDATQTIISLFRAAAKAHPGNTAVVYQDKRLTYSEVDDLTDRLAALISGKGLGKEDVVSVLIPRCEWMVLASLGVLKAGCAYQPLDPTYPAERLNFMMKDAGAKLLIADASLRDIVNEYTGDVLITSPYRRCFPAGHCQ